MMYISSKDLLVMAIGTSINWEAANYQELLRERHVVSQKLVERFGIHLFFELRHFKPRENLFVNFPRMKNKFVWEEYFELQNEGTIFYCKPEKFDNLIDDYVNLQWDYSRDILNFVMNKAIAEVSQPFNNYK